MKKSLSTNTLYVICLLLGISTPGISSANLIVNGSFESFSGTTILSTQPDRLFNNNSGSFNVPGWNFDIGFTSDIYRGMSAPGAISNHYQASDGNFFAGSFSRKESVTNGVHEGVAQTFNVNPNTTYELSFDLAPGGIFYETFWLEYPTVGPAGWDVSVTGATTSNVTQIFNTNINNFNSSITTNPISWETASLLFTSDNTGGLVTLEFVSFADDAQVFLDNVSVTEASVVPIPAAVWLFGSGLLGLIAFSRRNQT
jgi:hypothetical protein